MLKLTKSDGGERYTPEDLKSLSLDEVKKMIEQQVPGAFDKKGKKAATKKIPTAKAPAKKAASKKAAPKKAAVKKAVKKSAPKKAAKK
jgi:DNA topoisomerase-1